MEKILKMPYVTVPENKDTAEIIAEQNKTIDMLIERLKKLMSENGDMAVLLTAMVQSAGGEVIVRIVDYYNCMNGKYILSRRDGVMEGDVVFTTKELPKAPLRLVRENILH